MYIIIVSQGKRSTKVGVLGLPLLNNYDPERKGRIGVSGNYERKLIMSTNRIHRYEKMEHALKAIINFKPESKSLYEWHSFNIFRAALSRAIEECPGFVDSCILEYCDEIVNLSKSELGKIKDLAQQALNEIAWEKSTGNDLYPCIEI